jgi:hypothetical protein
MAQPPKDASITNGLQARIPLTRILRTGGQTTSCSTTLYVHLSCCGGSGADCGDAQEPDDDLHNPDPKRDRTRDAHLDVSMRGLINVGSLTFTIAGLIGLL